MCKKETINQLIPLTKKQKLYNEAVAFYELAECGRKNIPEQKYVESHIPYIVNMTFCSELLLKFLLLEEGKSTKDTYALKHNLMSLYDNLSLSTKEQIYHSFKRPLVYDINNELNKAKDAFVHWRYLVLDKINQSNEETQEYRRIPFNEWLQLTPSEKEKYTEMQNKRNRIAPFFLKEFNEILLDICRNHL